MPTSRVVLTRRALLTAAVCTPVLASCAGASEPAAARLKVAKAWSRTTYTGTDQDRVDVLAARLAVIGSTLVHADGTGDAARVVATDVANGSRRWAVGGHAPLDTPGAGPVRVRVLGPRESGGTPIQRPVLRSARGVLPLTYVSDSGRRTGGGVIGIRVDTGEPAWAFPAVREPSADRAIVTAASDTVVAVTVARRVGPQWPDEPVTTIGVDPATGDRRWSRRGLVALAADGDAVVAARQAGAGDWRPCVLDARTGDVRWQGDAALDGPYDHLATAGGYTSFDPGRDGDYDVVELSTGKRLDFAGGDDPRPVACDPPLLVWDNGPALFARGPNGFVTQTLPDGDPERGRGRPGGYDFTPVAGTGGPYVWGVYGGTNGGLGEPKPTQPQGVVAVDRTGAPCSPSLAGILAAVTGEWLVLAVSKWLGGNTHRTGYEVHRITRA